MNPRIALVNLVLAQDAVKSIGGRPFLADGTLLGAVREGGFIAHDKDTDMGVFIEDYRTDLIFAMQRRGFRVRRIFGSPGRGFQIAFRRLGVKLDMFFYYTDERGRYHAAWKQGEPIRYGYWHFDLAPIGLMGRTFLAPDDPERFLVTKYGPDWREPVTEWDWAWGPKNATAWVDA